MTRTDPGLLQRIEQLEAAVAELRAELAALRPRRRPDDAALVAGLAAHVGDVVFSARELAAHAQVDARLGRLLEAHGCVTVSRIGRRLRRLRGVVRIGRDRDGVVWAVDVDAVATSRRHGGAGTG